MDVLNIIALFTTEEKESFFNISPENLIVSNNDGRFNRDYQISKDQKLGIYILNN